MEDHQHESREGCFGRASENTSCTSIPDLVRSPAYGIETRGTGGCEGRCLAESSRVDRNVAGRRMSREFECRPRRDLATAEKGLKIWLCDIDVTIQ